MDAQQIEHAALDRGQQEEEPEPQGHVAVEQVGKTDQAQIEHHDESGAVPEEHEGGAHEALTGKAGEAGEGGEVNVDGIDHPQRKGNGEPDPHHPVSEKRLDQRKALVVLDHLQRDLDQGIDQPFLLQPLPAQDDHGAHHREIDRDDEQAPVEQGLEPGAPGNGLSRGEALVEVLHGIRVPGGYPAGHVRVHQLGPFVFGRGVVVEAGEDGEEVLGEADGGNGGGDHRHDVDRGQFGRAEGQAPPEAAQRDIDHPDKEEEEEEGGRGVEVVGQERPLHDHVGVGDRRGDQQRQERADQHRAQGDPGALSWGRLWSAMGQVVLVCCWNRLSHLGPFVSQPR